MVSWFGIGVHEAFAQWYRKGKRRGEHPARYFKRWVGDEIREIRAMYGDREYDWTDQPLYEDAGELGVAMLENYVDRYGKDQNWNVIVTEYPFRVRIMHQGRPIALFASTFDGVYRDENDGRFKLMEHKTASAIATAYLALDDQGGAYWAVATEVLRAKGLLGPKDVIDEITYNFLRKTKGDDREVDAEGRYLNQNGTVSKRQPPPAFVREPVERQPREVETQILRITDEVRIMNAMRDGSLPVTKTPTKDCPRCPFFIMCQLHERGGDDWKELASASYDQADPYERYLPKTAST